MTWEAGGRFGEAQILREVYEFPGGGRRAWACTTSTASIRGFRPILHFNYGLHARLPGLHVDQEHHS